MSPQSDLELKRKLKRAGFVAAGVLAIILVVGFSIRLVQGSALKTWTNDTQIPTVMVISPTPSGRSEALVLPGTLQAFYDAKIYSRVPGYVHAWYRDIGARVKKGDVLASIDTPELDQQIAQARADLGAAVSAQKLSEVTNERWASLLPLDAVSKQDAEEKSQDLTAKQGATKAAQANLDRLLAMKAFAQLVAPFDGVVTTRSADVGALVVAGPASNGDPLFSVSDIHALRVYVSVPQSYSAEIVPGMMVSLTVSEYPGRTFVAKLLSTSNAINTQSSTLLAEFEVDNASGLLKPGDYAEVSMSLPAPKSRLRLPASALLFRAQGLTVATLGPDNRIAMKPIAIDTDLGTQVIVASGLGPRDKVVDNPPDSLGNGDRVRVESQSHAD